MRKTNIRLFVPNTTEILDFEYGLLIQYMKYNEAKSRSEISLDYYELATIDPMTNALEIVERKIVTDTARMQSDRSGFTLDSHYTFSFDQRYNNKIPEQSVRQVWLWLHCNAEKERSFLVEKFTPAEDIVYSRNNQLLTRLWSHDDWLARDINPLDQQKVSGRIGLITLLRQQVATQFEQIEQDNRNKSLAVIQAANPKPMPANIVAAVTPITTTPLPFISVTTTVPPITPASPATPQNTVPINGNSEYVSPPQTSPAKSKVWIRIIAVCLVGIPVLIFVGKSRQERTSSYNGDSVGSTHQPYTQIEAASAAEASTSAIDNTTVTDVTTDAASAATETDSVVINAIQQEDKPQIIVGLEWHSKTTDYRDPRGSHDDVAYKITANQEGTVLIDKTITDRPDSKVTLMYDESLNLIGGKTGRYIPALANYDFPLTEGKTWKVTSEVIGNPYKDLQQVAGQVLGRENISTPMGEFEAIKIVVEHKAFLAGNEMSKGQDILWYVPELGGAVRTDETYWDAETQSWVLSRSHEMISVTFP